jgi:hypothetical protein
LSLSRGEGALVYHPVANPPTAGRVRPVTLPAAELAVTVHRGAHSDLDISYGQLGAYVTDHALAVAGPVREAYLVGPRELSAAVRTRTDRPVRRVAPPDNRTLRVAWSSLRGR